MAYYAFLGQEPGAGALDKRAFFLSYAQLWCGVQRDKSEQAHVLSVCPPPLLPPPFSICPLSHTQAQTEAQTRTGTQTHTHTQTHSLTHTHDTARERERRKRESGSWL
eukprot:1273320-Rhodomonas_salina.1